LRADATLPAAVASALRQANVAELAIVSGDVATAEVAHRLAAGDDRIAVIEHPTGRTPEALNAGIEATRAPVIVRLDAHAELPEGYVRTAVEVLTRTGAANVGGQQVPVGTSAVQRAIAAAMRSPAGSGGATYRAGGQAGPVDTVYLGVYRRDALEVAGAFDPRFVRNQDAELNLRLRRAGFTVWFDPRLAVQYRPRSSFGALARQYLQYGRWRRLTARVHRRSLRPRQVVAPLLVIGIAASAGASAVLLSPWPLLGVLAAYVLGVSIAAVRAAERLPEVPLVVVALVAMHLAWGVGFLLGPPRGIDGSSPYEPSDGRF